MPGLLGDGFNDPRSAAIMALAGNMVRGGLNGGFGGGLLAAQDAYQGQQDAMLKRQMAGVQMQDVQQQIRLRDLQAQQIQRQQDWMQGLLGDMNSPAPAQGSMSGPAIPPSQGGGMGSGTMGIPVGGQAAFGPATAPASTGGGSLIQQARALGIPDMAIKSDLALNGGKGIAEMIYKRGTPNMEFVGNVAVDKNKIGQNFSVPTVSQNGQASQTIADPTAPGGFRVIAPPGAMETYAGYRQADAGIAAGHELQKVWNPQTQRYEFTTKAQALQAAQPPQLGQPGARTFPTEASMTGAANVDMGPNPVVLASEIAKTRASIPMVNDPASKAMLAAHLADLQRQQAALPKGPLAAEPSASEAATNAAAQAGATTGATAAATSGQKYQDDLNSKVEEEFQLVNRNKQIQPLLDKFRTGGMMPEERLHLGNTIANSGMLPESIKGPLAAWVANGDPTAGKVIENQLASAGILNMLQTLDKEGKPNRAIFQAVQKAQEGLNSGNTTLKDVFELQKRLYDIHFNEQQALTKAIKSGTYDPRTWAGDYSSIRNADLNAPAIPLPSATASASNSGSSGAVVTASKPTLMDSLPKTAPQGARVRDTQTGEILTFNGLSWVKGK